MLLGRIEICKANSEEVICTVFVSIEVVKREVEEKDFVSPVWNKEKLRREKVLTGPHLFSALISALHFFNYLNPLK